MQIKSYTISTAVGLLAAGGLGAAASVGRLQPVAKNNARMEALVTITNYLSAKNCLSVQSKDIPEIGDPIDSKRQISTVCLYYPSQKRFAYIGRLNGQLQVVYVYTNTEVRKANSYGK